MNVETYTFAYINGVGIDDQTQQITTAAENTNGI